MMLSKIPMLAAGAAVAGILAASSASALVIDPASTTIAASGLQTGQNAIDAVIFPIISPATELYKDDVGGGESGSLAANYETQYFNTPGDPSEADISYVGGAIVDPNAWLLVKDGNHDPAWYLFDLTSLGWDGMDILELENFWPGNGAISHVTLYGGDGGGGPNPAVTEPAVLGLALAGLGGILWMRRRNA